jgi:uncharacterized membrane protein (UPF0127 family)
MTGMPLAKNPERFVCAALLLAIATMWLLASPDAARAQSGDLEDLAAFPRQTLTIHRGPGKKQALEFRVWVADTPRRQAQGLMFVRSLPSKQGMLFVHESPRPIGMWMKNTYIPLDMLFIDARGRIQQIVENAIPHSLDTIRSREPALAVLEIAGGEARRLGISPGQRVSHPAFTTP